MSVALNSKSTSVMSEKDDSKDAVVGSSPLQIQILQQRP